MNADILYNLDKAFDNRIRLSIMTILMVEDSVDYNSLKATLELTDGNLASHIKALEKEEYIKIEKSFLGKKPNTTYQITKRGKLAFDAHLNALEKMINQVQPTKKIKK